MTFREATLLRTKLLPARLNRRIMPRPELKQKILEALDYRLTLIQAGTGYGKSTTLMLLSTEEIPIFWFNVDEEEADVNRFLTYLIGSFNLLLTEMPDTPLAILQELQQEGSVQAWKQAVNALINVLENEIIEPSLLIIDDFHLVSDSKDVADLIEHFISYLPANLHVIIASRHPLSCKKIITWQAKGEVLEIGSKELAFEEVEIARLFRETYEMNLDQNECKTLAQKTEGWPIALQLVWQGLRNDRSRSVAEFLEDGPVSLKALFNYLTMDLYDRQSDDLKNFLKQSAVLRKLEHSACDAITGNDNGAILLGRLNELDLFVIELGDGLFRYQHLFHDFLRNILDKDTGQATILHQRAAIYFQQMDESEEAIYHWISARGFEQAAELIEKLGQEVLREGRLDTMASWIDELPAEVLVEHPILQYYLGDLSRLRSRFDEAMAWYQEAEQTWRANNNPAGVSRALRGQARVYLDTVRPAEAESLLHESLLMSDGIHDRNAQARLLRLMAENKLNLGKIDEAQRLRVEARAILEEGPREDEVGVRVKLRTGHFKAARQILMDRLEEERRQGKRGVVLPPRMHRETTLILSLIHSFNGQTEQALEMAQEGIELGERLDSPFISAVGLMRKGHACQLRSDNLDFRAGKQAYAEAIEYYLQAIAIGDRIAVRRTRVEAMWGLTRAYGFFGDIPSAEKTARDGIETAMWAGDQWIGALLEVTLGASYVQAGREEEGVEVLQKALISFRDCGDNFGRAVSRLWLCSAYLELGHQDRLNTCTEELFSLCEEQDYGFLFMRPTFLGPTDPRSLVPLLIRARDKRIKPAYVSQIITEIGVADIELHPGYQLKVQAFGDFRVWRGREEIPQNGWRRDKARQLFQLFLTHRDQAMDREQIMELLWPESEPESAQRDFKVALSTLYNVLEPGRKSGSKSAYITRKGSVYGLRQTADIWLDIEDYDQRIRLAEELDMTGDGRVLQAYREALSLYTGVFLSEHRYDDWCRNERERLLNEFLKSSDRMVTLLIEKGFYQEAIDRCQQILAYDNCWECAYRNMMMSYKQLKNRPQALRVYQRYVQCMREELDAEPTAEIQELYLQISAENTH